MERSDPESESAFASESSESSESESSSTLSSMTQTRPVASSFSRTALPNASAAS